MPRLVEADPKIARRITAAAERITAGKPQDAKLRERASKGTLKLNFATVATESKVARHLFDVPDCIYPEQYEAITAAMPKKGEVEPLALQLVRIRKELKDVYVQLEKSRDYAANLLTAYHLQELENARLKELLEGDAGSQADGLVGSGQLIGLPAPEARRPPPRGKGFGVGRKRA